MYVRSMCCMHYSAGEGRVSMNDDDESESRVRINSWDIRLGEINELFGRPDAMR